MKKWLYLIACAAVLAACSVFPGSDYTFISDESDGGGTQRHVVVANATTGGEVIISPLQDSYAHGAKVTLTAQPQSGYEFGYWDDGGMKAIRKITVLQDYELTATFFPTVAPYHVVLFGSIAGTVAKYPDQEEYAPGTEVTIVATPADGYKFEKWSDGNTAASRTLIVDQNIVLSASFEKDQTIPDPPVIEPSIEDVFVVTENVTLQTGESPSGEGLDPITDFVMNRTALTGGTLELSYYTAIEDHYVIVAIENVLNYFQVVPVADGDGHFHVILVLNQELINVDINVKIIIVANSDDNPVSSSNQDVEIVEVGSGQLQVSLSFNNDKDVDLHVVEPQGGHIFYSNRRSSNGGYLDMDSNAGCRIDGVNNENVFYSDDALIEVGEYKVYALMYSNCDATIATNYVLSVFYNGQLLCAPKSGTFAVGYPNEGSDISLRDPDLTFTITQDMLDAVNAPVRHVNFAPEKKHYSAILKDRLWY